MIIGPTACWDLNPPPLDRESPPITTVFDTNVQFAGIPTPRKSTVHESHRAGRNHQGAERNDPFLVTKSWSQGKPTMGLKDDQ